MGRLAVGRDEVFRVDVGKGLVILRFLNVEFFVVGIDAGGASRNDLVRIECEGLAAAVDAAVGACHDFDDVIGFFALADGFADFVSVGKSVNLAEVEGDAGNGEAGFADAIGTTDSFEFDVIGFDTGELFGGIAENGFGDATGGAEDNAGTGFEAERFVTGNGFETVEVDTGFADHVGQFDGCHGEIGVFLAVDREFGTVDFEFLGRAGHDRNDDDFLVGLVFSVCSVANEGREHLLGRFAGREIVEHIMLIFFCVFDPCGAAGCEDGEFSAVLDAADDFVGFLDGGEVGSEGGIIDGIEADFLHGGDHFAHAVGAGFEAEFFADGNADGRSDLGNDISIGIVDGFPDIVVVGVSIDGA